MPPNPGRAAQSRVKRSAFALRCAEVRAKRSALPLRRAKVRQKGRLCRFAVEKSGRKGRLCRFARAKSGRKGRLSCFARAKSGPQGAIRSLRTSGWRPRPSRTQISAKLGPRGSGQKNAHGGYFADVPKEAACAEFFASWLKYLFTSIRRNLRKLRIMLFVLFRRILRNK